MPGYFCSVKKSSIVLHCGVFSYNQVVALPDTEVSVHITGAQCDTMVQESMYRTLDSVAVPIQWNIENVIKFTLGGEMHATTSHVNYCSGTRIKVKTGFIDEGLELDQIKVLIRKT